MSSLPWWAGLYLLVLTVVALLLWSRPGPGAKHSIWDWLNLLDYVLVVGIIYAFFYDVQDARLKWAYVLAVSLSWAINILLLLVPHLAHGTRPAAKRPATPDGQPAPMFWGGAIGIGLWAFMLIGPLAGSVRAVEFIQTLLP
ncbi:MAG: hypothetical protein EPO12_00620 [Aquabacterium sp.]|nr:MAG: hypothetical protein EPO12_00620 [Aquabacterium sp.]